MADRHLYDSGSGAIAMENLANCFQPYELSPVGEPAAEIGCPVYAQAPAVVAPGFVQRWSAFELRAVHAATRTARAPVPRRLAICASWLGNGWIYPLLFGAIFAKLGVAGLRILAPAAVVAALLHCVYPLMKKYFNRRRPFQADPRLQSLLNVLDEHSFPSGHTMTLAGVLTPVVLLWPAALLSALLVCGCVAWSRVATAHHYPSDVVAGAALGVGIGYPLTICLIPLWG